MMYANKSITVAASINLLSDEDDPDSIIRLNN